MLWRAFAHRSEGGTRRRGVSHTGKLRTDVAEDIAEGSLPERGCWSLRWRRRCRRPSIRRLSGRRLSGRCPRGQRLWARVMRWVTGLVRTRPPRRLRVGWLSALVRRDECVTNGVLATHAERDDCFLALVFGYHAFQSCMVVLLGPQEPLLAFSLLIVICSVRLKAFSSRRGVPSTRDDTTAA